MSIQLSPNGSNRSSYLHFKRELLRDIRSKRWLFWWFCVAANSTNVLWSSCKVPVTCPVLSSDYTVLQVSSNKFHEYPSTGNRIDRCGQI